MMKAPNWLRWILVLPCAHIGPLFIASLLTFLLVLPYNLIRGGVMPVIGTMIMMFLNGIGSSYFFVLFGAKMAPNYKFITASILALYFILFEGWVIKKGSLSEVLVYLPFWISLVFFISIIVGLTLVLLRYRKKIR
jgi:hypothetical protein